MPLAYDPAYVKAIEPLLPLLASLPKPKIHDIQTRRDNLTTLFEHTSSVLTFPDSITQSTITIPSYDSTPSSLLRPHRRQPHPPRHPIAHTTTTQSLPTFSVAYRKAPEHPFPTAVEDGYAALLHLHTHAVEYNIDAARIVLMGESAGGGIAAGVTLMARDRGLRPEIRKLVLGCPMLDDRTGEDGLGEGPLDGLVTWTLDSNVTGWTAYLAGEEGNTTGRKLGVVSPYAAPARAETLAGLPDVFVDVPELDVLRAEVVEFVGRLLRENAGRRVEFHMWNGVPHAFELLAPELERSRLAREMKGRALREV